MCSALCPRVAYVGSSLIERGIYSVCSELCPRVAYVRSSLIERGIHWICWQVTDSKGYDGVRRLGRN